MRKGSVQHGRACAGLMRGCAGLQKARHGEFTVRR